MGLEQRTKFLTELMQGWSPSYAAMSARVPRSIAYNYREINEDFRKQWDAAVEAGTDFLEDVAKRRAVEGWEEPLTYKGVKTGQSIKRYNDVLLMMQLNGRRPEKYRQNVKIDAPDLASTFRAAMTAAVAAAPRTKPNGHAKEEAATASN